MVELPVTAVPAVANPFDPAAADVWADLVGPGGTTITTPAFFTQDHERELIAGEERLTPTGPGRWLVRATPTVPGTWDWTASASISGGPATTVDSGSFECTADAISHGFLRRSPEDPRYLRWEDGTPYTAIGENLAWYDRRGTFAYDAWLDRLAAHGANWIRVWMPSWAFGLEWLTRDAGGVIVTNSLGDYTTRLDRAWQLDLVIEAARARGMVVMLTIQNHGPFTLDANTQWDDNPYNAANGGPLARPEDFFTDGTAKNLFERRLRYVQARWGYATNLIWELWNEVDLTGAPVADITSWHAEMADELRRLDPYDHLLTTSVDGGLLADLLSDAPPVWLPLFELPQIDIVQAHVYGIGDALPLNFVELLPDGFARLAELGKPVLLGEAGVDYRGPAETIAADPTGQGFHELLWAGLFVGGSGSGMTWWWDNVIDPQDLYPTFDGLRTLTDGIALDREHVVLDGAVALDRDGGALQAFPLRGERTVLVWIRNPANWWHRPDHTEVRGATVALSGLADGTWHLDWVDPFSATVSDGGTVDVSANRATVAVPTFSRELSMRLTYGVPSPSPNPSPTASPSATPIDRRSVVDPVVAEPDFTG